MEFQGLSEDDIRSIFSFCDIYAAVAMSRTVSRSEIQGHSQEALVALLKRLLAGPESWTSSVILEVSFVARSRLSSPRPARAKISKQITLHPTGIRSSKKNEVKLLGGGEYVLLNSLLNIGVCTITGWFGHTRGTLQIHTSWNSLPILPMEVKVPTYITVCEKSWTHKNDPRAEQSLIQIVKLDFRTGISTRLLVVNPCSGGNYFGFLDAKICVLANKPSGGLENRVINYTAFSSHWQQTAGHPTFPNVDVSDLKAVICESITFGICAHFRNPWQYELYVYQSPLKAETYRVWVILSGFSSTYSD
ncbi:hypothetical protein DFH09DRAFT_1437379 [Mycena vulgaris]|nr:hypothetical protein DFH09DRAFT_1437379 [Mycena vulgaris]